MKTRNPSLESLELSPEGGRILNLVPCSYLYFKNLFCILYDSTDMKSKTGEASPQGKGAGPAPGRKHEGASGGLARGADRRGCSICDTFTSCRHTHPLTGV